MKTEKYSMSFTTGGLFYQESLKVAGLYFEVRDWNKVSEEIIEKNLLQTRTVSTSKRVSREICSRLKRLNESELDFFLQGSHQEQCYILWIAVCRRYQFVRDFAVEIVRERFLTFRHDLNREDYDAFYNAKAEWHDELEKISSATRDRLRQVVFKMLREADLLDAENTLNPAALTPGLASIIRKNSQEDFFIFPVMESELKEAVK